MGIFMASLVVALGFIFMAAWRVSRTVSWRALAQIALATGSLESCVAFIRFCVRR